MNEEVQPEEFPRVSEEEANELVLEYRGWAESIARSVARAWNLDWQLDGLDGAAMEALIFCSRRFRPGRGVPFKGYARKRIHEASCDAARKSKGWHKAGSSSATQQAAREISMELIDIFPELGSGSLPMGDGDDERAGVRSLLIGASLIAARQSEQASLDDILDCRKVLRYVAALEPIHQEMIWKIYWEGSSMRSVASSWDTDELNVIREHKSLVDYLHKCISKGQTLSAIRVRPGLKDIAARINKSDQAPPFSKLLAGAPA